MPIFAAVFKYSVAPHGFITFSTHQLRRVCNRVDSVNGAVLELPIPLFADEPAGQSEAAAFLETMDDILKVRVADRHVSIQISYEIVVDAFQEYAAGSQGHYLTTKTTTGRSAHTEKTNEAMAFRILLDNLIRAVTRAVTDDNPPVGKHCLRKY